MKKNDPGKANDGAAAEKLREAVRDYYEAAFESTAAVQESNARLARSFVEGSIEALEAQAEVSHHTLQSLAELAREQQEAFQELSRRSLDAYDGFLDSLFSYYKEVLKKPRRDRRSALDPTVRLSQATYALMLDLPAEAALKTDGFSFRFFRVVSKPRQRET
jgi:hypothetical protein